MESARLRAVPIKIDSKIPRRSAILSGKVIATRMGALMLCNPLLCSKRRAET